jgi:hypothetical protein
MHAKLFSIDMLSAPATGLKMSPCGESGGSGRSRDRLYPASTGFTAQPRMQD